MSSGKKWYILYNDSTRGPFTSGQMRRLAQRNQISQDMQVRVGESGKWRAASEVKGLFDGVIPVSEPSSTSDSDSSADLSDASEAFSPETPDFNSLAESPIADSPIAANNSTSLPPIAENKSEVPVDKASIPAVPDIFGEVPSSPPPAPNFSGSVQYVPSSTSPPPIQNNNSSFAFTNLPVEPKPLKSANRSRYGLPFIIQLLLKKEEVVLYSQNPSVNALAINCMVCGWIYALSCLLPVFIALVTGGITFAITYLFFGTIGLGIGIALNYLRWLNLFYVITDQRTLVKSGILSVNVGYVYNSDIQIINIKTGLVDKMLHLNTVELRTSAGCLLLRWVKLEEVLQHYTKK